MKQQIKLMKEHQQKRIIENPELKLNEIDTNENLRKEIQIKHLYGNYINPIISRYESTRWLIQLRENNLKYEYETINKMISLINQSTC